MKLKKFIAVILTTLTAACIAVGFSGCKEDADLYEGYEFTAASPIIEYTSSRYPYLIEDFNDYDEYIQYYIANFAGSNMYLFNNVESDYRKGWPDLFSFYRNSKTESFIAEQIYTFYKDELGLEGDVYFKSAFISVLIKPITNYQENKLTLEFGKNGRNSSRKYINVYCGEEGFATCYFINYVLVQQKWWTNFITENLIWMG